MRKMILALVITFTPGIVLADVRFDGMWQTTVSCEASRSALGYSYRFISTVKNGVIHGIRGTAGQPGVFEINGKIPDSGNTTLYGNGIVASKEFVPGLETPRGSPFGYHITTHFDATTGKGIRVEGRPCTLDFEKQ